MRIVRAPYTPHVLGYPEVHERADLVIRSSANDEGHCNTATIQGESIVVTATEISSGGIELKGIKVVAIPARESLIYEENPGNNAMYRFALENMQISQPGDDGITLSTDQVAALQNTDVLMVPAGGPPTINLDDLWEAIALIRPRIVIPMHYQLPKAKVKMLSVTEFTTHFPPAIVDWWPNSEVDFSLNSLPREMRIGVLSPGVFS